MAKVTFDTSEPLSSVDLGIIRAMTDVYEENATQPAESPAEDDQPEPEVEEPDPRFAEAAKLATDLLSSGNMNKVSTALAQVEAARVREIDPSRIDEFLTAIKA